jgi:hypothetical protein
MTLDPVHLDGIADLVRQISGAVDEGDHADLAEEVWEHFLDPLSSDGAVVLEPVEERRRFRAPPEAVGVEESAFDAVHGLDSGTLTPQAFTNGLVLDVAQAAMSATPTDLSLHRSRTIVAGVHSNDAGAAVDSDWFAFDEEYVRGRAVRAPEVGHDPETVVKWLSLYLAESEHALHHAADVPEMLILDGPLYPKELVRWATRHSDLAALVADESRVRTVVENYLLLIERFVERGVPLVGFVKGARSRALVTALRDRIATPWVNDLSLFARILGRPGPDEEAPEDLRWTNWFVSRLGADGAFARNADVGIKRERAPEEYEVAFFVVYDPRTDLAFKVELPAAFARDADTREAVQRHVLREVAAEAGPPTAVAKADSLARVGRSEKESLRRRLEGAFDTRWNPSYDAHRWGIGSE